MRAATTAAAWAMNKAMMAAGIIGIIFMIIQGISALIGFFRDLDETAKKMRKETEDLTDSLKTLNEELIKKEMPEFYKNQNEKGRMPKILELAERVKFELLKPVV